MGMFDDLEVSSKATVVPEDFRQRHYQTKDLDCDGSVYRIDSANQFLKVECPIGKPEKLLYAQNLNQDVGCYDFGYDFVLQVRNGIVVGCETGTSDADYWDGVEPIWMPFIESESRG
ncbi:hypothetical protein [Haliea sp.]|jgi:hypothetical protein|uniref:hypothetical protein n=1 Tax=Haliea sp. TaxID=1932666 RepID=UPI00257BCE13|nr:hypothetical protein [Haliea sp.]|tara:strand:+ start:7689 stop:8039 length:351 start_codon:yes stop_codon:yes gene_type:complete